MNTLFALTETILVIAIAPLVSGFIAKLKNSLRMRKGPPVLQPYYNFIKLFSKGEVVSENSSWIFRIAPFVALGSCAAACLLLPIIGQRNFMNYAGDFVALIFILSLGRFFLALAGLDTASAFGGMGSSREMFISSIAEPAAIAAIFVAGLNCGSTSLAAVSGFGAVKFSSVIAAISLFMVAIAETSRVPVDNQETHLELTMIHEAMILEYSGRSLAFIEMANHIRQIIFFSLIGSILFPVVFFWPLNINQVFLGMILYSLKIVLISAIVVVVEIAVAKMRLFRVVDFLSFSFILAMAAVVACALGV